MYIHIHRRLRRAPSSLAGNACVRLSLCLCVGVHQYLCLCLSVSVPVFLCVRVTRPHAHLCVHTRMYWIMKEGA